MKKSIRALGAGTLVGVVGLATLVSGAGAAQADPPAGTWRSIVAVGSNTTEDLYNAFGNGFKLGSVSYTPTGTPALIASYNSTGTATIQTHAGGTIFTRPNGSGDGRKALSAAWDPSNHVWSGSTLTNADVTIARSSSRPSTAVAYNAGSPSDNVFIPLARDGVGVLSLPVVGGPTVTDLKLGALEAIYGAADSTESPVAHTGVYKQGSSVSVGDVQISGSGASQVELLVTAISPSVVTTAVQPELPQSSSGTRSFFLKAIGAGSTIGTNLGAWVGQTSNEENSGSWLAAGQIVPFSGAAAIEQYRTLITNTIPSASSFPTITISGTTKTLFTVSGSTYTPGGLYGSTSTVPTGNVGDFSRDVYSVLPNSQLNTTYGGTALHSILDTDLVNAKDTGSTYVTVDFGFLNLGTTYTSGTSRWFQAPFEH